MVIFRVAKMIVIELNSNKDKQQTLFSVPEQN